MAKTPLERNQLYLLRCKQSRQVHRTQSSVSRPWSRPPYRSTAPVLHQKNAALSRKIGKEQIDHCRRLFGSVSGCRIEEAFYCAALAEIGLISRSAEEVEQLIARAVRDPISWVDFVYDEAAAGLACLMDLRYECARQRFEQALNFRDRLDDPFLTITSLLGISRCARQEGEYRLADLMAKEALGLSKKAGSPETAAVADAIRAWCSYKTGDYEKARALLTRSENTLEPTDDWIAKGNIATALGRIEAKKGMFVRAMRCYSDAEERFGRALSQERAGSYNARLQINVSRLLRQEAQKLFERGARDRAREIQDDILENRLPLAEALYKDCYPRGEGAALLIRGSILLDQGQPTEAARLAERACDLARDREGFHDHVLAAGALSLWACADIAAVDDLMADDPDHQPSDEIDARKGHALASANRAVTEAEAAGKTPRVFAEANIALTLARFINDKDATLTYRTADVYARKSRDEHLQSTLQAVRERLFGAATGPDLKAVTQELQALIGNGSQASELREKVVDLAILYHWHKLEVERPDGKKPTLTAVRNILGTNDERVKKPLLESGLWPRR